MTKKESIRYYEGLISYFSNDNKVEREKWVCKEFLSVYGLKGLELRKGESEPTDVHVLSFNFQVKELFEEGRQRCREYKDTLNLIKSDNQNSKKIDDWNPKYISVEEMCQTVVEKTKEFENKYAPTAIKDIDLLIYANLNNTVIEEIKNKDISIEVKTNFRTISFLYSSSACIIHTASDFVHELSGFTSKYIVSDGI